MAKLQRGLIPKTISKNFVPIIISLSAKGNDVLGIKLLLKIKKKIKMSFTKPKKPK